MIPERVERRGQRLDGDALVVGRPRKNGRVISVDKALNLVNEALTAPVLMLRRLPELASSPAEKSRLETFLNAILSEIKTGAENGLAKVL